MSFSHHFTYSCLTAQSAPRRLPFLLLLWALVFTLTSLNAQVVNEEIIQPVGAVQSSLGFANGEATNAIDGNTKTATLMEIGFLAPPIPSPTRGARITPGLKLTWGPSTKFLKSSSGTGLGTAAIFACQI